MSSFRKFWVAARKANAEGRLQQAKRITNRDTTLTGFNAVDQNKLRVETLGPVPLTQITV